MHIMYFGKLSPNHQCIKKIIGFKEKKKKKLFGHLDKKTKVFYERNKMMLSSCFIPDVKGVTNLRYERKENVS